MSPSAQTAAVLPPLYAAWIDELIGEPVPAETDANCSHCVMCNTLEETDSSQGYWFDPGVKCCTFFPRLPNFLAGGVLNQGGSAANHLEAMIHSKSATTGIVTPLGIDPSSSYSLRYANAHQAIGRDHSLACPYLTNTEQHTQCGIWQHRQSTCATWFCKYRRGKTGETFWHALHKLLAAIETNLKWWCILQSGFKAGGLSELQALNDTLVQARDTGRPANIDLHPRSASYRKLWAPWRGRETDFYRMAGDRVKDLTWSRVRQLAGQDVDLRAQLVLDTFAQLVSTDIPTRLKMGSYRVIWSGPSVSRVVAYRELDPVELPNAVLALLHFFDSDSTRASVARILTETGYKLEAGLIRKLVDHGLLESAGGGGSKISRRFPP